MKKTIMILGVAGLLSLASCKKDWSCLCTDQNGNQTSTNIKNSTLIDARNTCKSKNYDQTVLGVHTSESCSLQ